MYNKEISFIDDFSEASLSFYPSTTNTDDERTLKLSLSLRTETNNSSLTIRQKITFTLYVLYDLIFYKFNQESKKVLINKIQCLSINRNKVHQDYVEYLCKRIKFKKSEGHKILKNKLFKKFLFIDSSITIFLVDINRKFTDFFNSRNFGKIKIIKSVKDEIKKVVPQKKEKIYYCQTLGLFGVFFYSKYENNDYIRLSSIKIKFNEEDIYKNFIFTKYINEYLIQGYDIEQMIISFLIKKEIYFNLIVYESKSKIKIIFNEDFPPNLIDFFSEERENAYLKESTLYHIFEDYEYLK